MTVPFVGGSYELQRKKADVQRSVNMVPTPVESGSGKTPMYLAPVPGLTQFSRPCLCESASVRIVASDGYIETLSSGYEYIVAVDDEVWWSGDFGVSGQACGEITDLDATGGYPGPTNITAFPTDFDAFGWAVSTYVWTWDLTQITRVDKVTKAKTHWSRADIYSLHVDSDGGVWVRNAGNPIKRIDPTNAVSGADTATRTFSAHSVSVVFVGEYAFGTVEGGGPAGLPNLHRIDADDNEEIFALSGATRPEHLIADPDRGTVWCWWPAESLLVEVSQLGNELRSFTLDTLANAPSAGVVYDSAHRMLWALHNTGSTPYVIGVSTTTGELKFQQLISVAGVTSVPDNTGVNTITVASNGTIMATAINNGPTGGLGDNETMVIGFECVCD